MRALFLRVMGTAALVVASATVLPAQKPEFSADMKLLDGNGRTEIVKLYLGNQRARIDRTATPEETNGISSLILDFDNQFLYLLIPKSKVYLRIAGSTGVAFYQAAWMFRPSSTKYPCGQWISEADRRGVTLRCTQAGEDHVNARITQKWDATSPEGAHGSLWYDASLNFVVKVLRTSKDGVESGYELQNINEGTQPQKLFDPYTGYKEFSINKLLDVLTGVGQ